MEPLATYRDVRIEGKRTFELFPDRPFVRGYISLKSNFEINPPLRVLNPVRSRIRARSSVFRTGMLLSGVGSIFALGLFDMRGPVFFFVLALSLGLAGVFIMLVTLRKIEYAAFQNTSGVTVLMVSRSGPDVKKFDAFVEILAAKIGETKPLVS